jgi:hypothetical protein
MEISFYQKLPGLGGYGYITIADGNRLFVDFLDITPSIRLRVTVGGR